MNFVVIDFETATPQRDSACALGLTEVCDLQIVQTKSWLIKPSYTEFHAMNMAKHGITPRDVANQLRIDELWSELQPLLEGKLIVAHNASFDVDVLCKTLQSYNITYPNARNLCSYLLAQSAWKDLPSHKLNDLCAYHGIALNHHEAGSDSYAAAMLTIKAFNENKVLNLNDIEKKFSLLLGTINSHSYTHCYSTVANVTNHSKRKPFENYERVSSETLKQNLTDADPNNPFYDKKIVFTGVMDAIGREAAAKKVQAMGADVNTAISKLTDFVVMGRGAGPAKMEKIAKLNEAGACIKILNEEEFLKLTSK